MADVAVRDRLQTASQRTAELSGVFAVLCLVALANLGLILTVPAYARLTGANHLSAEFITMNWWLVRNLLVVSISIFSVAGLTSAGLQIVRLR